MYSTVPLVVSVPVRVADKREEQPKSANLQTPVLWRDAVGKMLSDSALGHESDDEQPVYVSDLLACDWIRNPETKLYFHRADDAIQVYYNGRMHELPMRADILDCLQQLCALREWPLELVNRCIDIEPLEKLLVEMASNAAILPIND